MSSSSSSSLSFPPVVPRHCLSVPVLYELVRGEEEHCRVWLRAEMHQIVDPLIDSLFHGLIMSSSSSAVPQHSPTVVELCQLLEGEKVEVSRVLMGEMNRLVNTLFERLNNKLVTNADLYRSEVGGDRAQVVDPFDQVESPNSQSHQPSFLIAQPSTFGLDSHQPHSNGDQLELNTVEMIEDCVNECSVNDINEVFEDGQGGDDESRSVENAPMDTTPAQPIGQSQVNRQSGRVEKRKQTYEEPQPQVQNEVNNEKDVEEDEDGDGDGEEVTARKVKLPRSALPSTSSSAQEKLIITLSLRCPEMCVELIGKHDLNDHLMEKHSIGQFRCAIKDCAQSFDKQYLLTSHLAQSHPHTTQWHCDKCEKHCSTYKRLSTHNFYYHQLGHFQCSFPECTFTGEYRKKVYAHYEYHHKAKAFVCGQSGCDFRTKHATLFKAHELTHLGAKPYHCKWSDCRYSNASRNATMMHIKRSHFKSRSKTRPDLTHLGKPNDYIEFVP